MHRNRRRSLIMCAVMLVVCAALCLLPDTQNVTGSFPRAQVRIDSVDNTLLDAIGIAYNGVQTCRVTVLTGEWVGQEVLSYNYMNSVLDKDKLFAPGDVAWAMLQEGGRGLTVTLIDHYRTRDEGLILLALAGALILFGGVIGCGALVSLVASAVIIWKLLIPLLLQGVSPIAAAFVTVLVLTLIIDLLVAGPTRRCAVAVIGSLAGTVVTCAAAWGLTVLLKLDGGDLPYVVPLLAQSSMAVDTRALYIGMMFLANSGALMDLSMDIAASCQEVVHHRPDVGRGELLRSGIRLGRSVLGTMTTTLMLAYSGNYLSMLMYFAGQGTPLSDVINLKYVASQLLNTLVGSFGLVAAAPLTALIASLLCAREGRAAAPDAEIPRDRA